MTAPNKEAVEAAREKLARGRMAAWPGYPGGTTWENINQTQRDHWLGEVSPVDVESVAALPFLAPQPNRSDEERARELVMGIECIVDGDPNPWDVMKATKALAAVRAEATLACAVVEREACAIVADPTSGHVGIASKTRRETAAAIRARKP